MVTARRYLADHFVHDVNQLITTKLDIPQGHHDLIARPHLSQRIYQGFGSTLTLITAPAGWGKTTLLSQWSLENRETTAWVTLDANDNDAHQFWRYVLTAIQTSEAHIGKTAAGFLPTLATSPAEPLITALINEIAQYDTVFHLILDNYHCIESSAIHQSVTFLLEHAPENFHLVIASRTRPPLSLARIRASGKLTELRMADLRFSFEETQHFFQGDARQGDDIRQVHEHAEGWITGIRLVALALPEQRYAHPFGSSHRFVMEYLREEVFAPLHPALQNFMVRTAVLEHLTAPVCATVSGAEASHTMLDLLESLNLVMVVQEGNPPAYRYHRMLREFLLTRLHQQRDVAIQSHRQAAEWYASIREYRAAVEHALAAEAYEYAVELIVAQAENMWVTGAITTLHDWLNALPQQVFQINPMLCLLRAWALFFTANDLQLAHDLLNQAESLLTEAANPGRGILAAVRAAYALREEHLQRAITLSNEALSLLPDDMRAWRSTTLLGLGVAHVEQGDMDSAGEYLTDAVILAEASGNAFTAIIAIYNQGRVLIHQGHLQQAAQTFQQALQRAEQSQISFPIAGTAHIGLGFLLYEWSDLEAAAEHLHAGIDQCQALGNLEAPIRGYIHLACIKLAQQDIDGAITMNTHAEQLAQRANLKRMAERIITYRARLWLLHGNVETAFHWMQKSGLTLADEPDFLRETDYLTLAHIAMLRGEAKQALPLLATLRAKAERTGRTYAVIQAGALEALAWQVQDDTEQALDRLERVLTLAEVGGFIRLFVDMGKPMATLLRHAASRGILPGYVGKLLGAFGGMSSHPDGDTQPLIDPLSERELEVLQLIMNGLSNQEIAGELVVAMSTVKTHVKKIYRKLNVSNRTQATTRARELSLL
ncbi:MAG: tetratricopeptide repeat protein [Anaerolineaceae bacterium]|nr:tetratricopeptide repeat protein [Anaerolineaceae bacterium]